MKAPPAFFEKLRVFAVQSKALTSLAMTPDEMIERLNDPKFQDDGSLANELLSQAYGGYPVENLKRLLATPNGISVFAFIVYELGQKARPLLREIVALLDSEHPGARWEAIEALRQCVTWQDGAEIAAIIMKVDDADKAVRLQAMRAITYLSYDNLRAGLDFLKLSNPESVFAKFQGAFLAIELRQEPERLPKLISSDNPIVRRFGAALAMRARLPNAQFVGVATSSEDPEVLDLVRRVTE